jgi:hypothetical protein
MEQREGNSSFDLSEPLRHFTHILLLRKSTWHNTTRGPYTQQPRYHVGPFDLAFMLEMTTPQL